MKPASETDPIDIHSALYWLICFWIIVEIIPGGLLHLSKLPVTGIVVGSLAVLSQVLIFRCTKSPSDILRATAIVLSAKLVLTPFAGPTALFAVAIQGLTGAMLLGVLKGCTLGVFMLSLVTMLVSSVMRWLSLTLLFGVGVWKGLDQWVDELGNSIGLEWLQGEHIALIYVIFHAIWGVILGVLIARYLRQIDNNKWPERYQVTLNSSLEAEEFPITTKYVGWTKRFIMLIPFILLLFWLQVPFSWRRLAVVFIAVGILYILVIKKVKLSNKFKNGAYQMTWV